MTVSNYPPRRKIAQRSGTSLAALLAALFLITPAPSAYAASTSCPANFFGGQAPDLVNAKLAARTYALCFSEFAVLDSGLTRTPLYSADRLTAQRIAQASRQRRADAADTFHEETRLPAQDRARLSDYARSGYDRGHMSPNGDMSSAAAQGESFTLANMVPQNADNNRHLWEGIEATTRSLASRYGEVYVVTVPIFAGAQTQWLHNRVAIPARLAKAIYVPALRGAAVYLTDNAPGMQWQTISVAQLRDLSGIDAFPALAEPVKEAAINLPEPKPFSQSHEPRSYSGENEGKRYSNTLLFHSFKQLMR
ncbi:DNA/RNA non-specific endonuclease [Bordetella sp. FB-8]|uniref:DNA/RNA non-specific endonuclease n=1 Tax=Bordetella sp. FB-8 TaxID=1159870 RepID=UPI0003611011|nr:DNA/RNA non-specific endonuclease [Bordetella sp. FB-8]